MGYAPHRVVRPNQAVSIVAAAQAQPTLARQAGLAQRSQQLLVELRVHVPPTIRTLVQAGPIDGDTWCLLVTSNAAAAKLRQLSPLMLSKLNSKGVKVTSIRLKILMEQKR